MTPLRTLQADKGKTVKTLWKLFDGALVESVLMRYPGRVTMCVSSQAGCGMACPFCATGAGGLQRNMSTAEIVEIGRASCRERVCQYVWISVVAASLTKNNKNNNTSTNTNTTP